MKINPDKLTEMGYLPFDTLPHNDLAKFLQPYLFKKNKYVIFYQIATFTPLFLWLGLITGAYLREGFDADFLHFFYGFSLAFLLIPLHEYLHALAYRYVGATQISYGADIKKFVFFALADKFVADSREFRIVALTPFVCITLFSIFLCFFLPIQWIYTVLGLIFTHSLFCGGDFGLLSYLWEHREKNLVTFDDVPAKVSYFYMHNSEK